MDDLKELFDKEFIEDSDNLWIMALFLLLFVNKSGGTTINLYFNDEKVGV